MALFNVGPYARLWISMTIWLQVDNPSVLRVLQLREMAETLQNNTKYSIMNQKVKRCHDLMSHQEVINSFLSVASINSIAFYWSVYLCAKKKNRGRWCGKHRVYKNRRHYSHWMERGRTTTVSNPSNCLKWSMQNAISCFGSKKKKYVDFTNGSVIS